MSTVSGTIKNIIKERGFGFIKVPGGESVFFHMSALTDGGIFTDLEVGDPVTFDVVASPKGPRARWVTVVSGSSAASRGASSGEAGWKQRVSEV